MEDTLKILKVKYCTNHLLDHTQTFYLSLDVQTTIDKSLKLRQTLMKDNLNLNTLKVVYLRNHLLDHT